MPRQKKNARVLPNEVSLNILDVDYSDVMEKSYIDYSMSVITARAVPDVKDGLKPVQRRILFDMNELGVSSDRPFRKSARIVGDTMGKYHPHGDCLDADTKVLLVSGEVKTIKELYEAGEPQKVLCFDEAEDQMTWAEAHDFRIGQYSDTMYDITLLNGYTITATGNHPFKLSNGVWLKAEELRPNMLISFTDAEISPYRIWKAFKRMNGDIFRVNTGTFETQFYPEIETLPSFRPMVVTEIEKRKYQEIPTFAEMKAVYPDFKGDAFNDELYKGYIENCFAIIKDVTVRKLPEPVPMYDFTVDEYHNMFILANNDATMHILVHNSSIYEAMVVMAQDFKKGVPLVDGHGNFGSYEGDGAAASRYCVTGDTLIPTDKGLLPIKDICPLGPDSEAEIDISVKSRDGAVQKADRMFNSGLHDVFTVRLENGMEVTGTKNHPLLVSEDGKHKWKTIEELSPGDMCVLDTRTENALFGTNNDLGEAEMLGSMIATGYRLYNGVCGFNSTCKKLIEPVKAFAERSIEEDSVPIRRLGGNGLGSVLNYLIEDPFLCKTFHDRYGLGYMRDREVPACVMQGTKEYMRAFFRFYFSTNGTVKSTDAGYLTECMAYNKKLARQLQVLLISCFGIPTYMRKETLQTQSVYYLTIKGTDICRFAQEIGFVDEGKRMALENAAECVMSLPGKETEDISPITEIKQKKKKEEVFSLRVASDCHSFSGNGLLNHNTEARLQSFTEDVFLRDLKNGTVDFVPNYDETEKEPAVLPCRLPNLLINGSEGIAVGMTTSIPPHNVTDVIDTAISYAKNPKQTSEELLATLKGPDFPTGGIVANASALPEIYSTGQGKIRVRGKVETERADSGRWNLVVTEIPYTMLGTGIAKFLSDTASLVEDHTLPEVSDILNQSSKEGIRIVLELKKGVKEEDLERLKNILYKKTRLEDTFGVSMLAIHNGVPEIMSLKSILAAYYSFQEELLVRKAGYLLEKDRKKKEINEGLLKATDCIDTIIELLRGSKNVKMARACLEQGITEGIEFKTKKAEKEASKFRFTEVQATAILEMKLSRLIRLELNALIKEIEETEKRIKYFESILSDKSGKIKKKEIIKELESLKEKYPQKRKTTIKELALPTIKEKEEEECPVVLLIDRFMYVHSVDLATYEKNKEAADAEFKLIIPTMSRSKTVLFTDAGKMHTLKVSDIPAGKLRDKGQPMDNLCGYDSKKENIVGFFTLDGMTDRALLFVLSSGFVKRVELSEFDVTRKTIDATKLPEGDRLVSVLEYCDKGHLLLHSSDGYFLRALQEEIPVQKKTAVGVKGITLHEGDAVDAAYPLKTASDTFSFEGREYEGTKIKLQKRGGKGVKTTI